MKSTPPRLAIGLPVFNGEAFLEEALDSLLRQTFADFELILSDNASTDRTAEICQAFVAKDSRVRYHRNPTNIGAMQNWYHSFELSSGEYFAGAAHDDVYHPEFLSKCVAVLDQNPNIVVCYTKTKVIDERGRFVRNFDVQIDTMSPRPHVRLYNAIGVDYLCIQLFGVMRSSAFGKTQTYTGYYGCDRNTLAELCLLGEIYEVPEYLFFHRLHTQALGTANKSSRSLQELQLLDPGTNWQQRYPTLTRFRNYFSAIARAPLSSTERARCYLQIVRLISDKSANRIRRRLKAASL